MQFRIAIYISKHVCNPAGRLLKPLRPLLRPSLYVHDLQTVEWIFIKFDIAHC
jgi:hypothetical protein